MTERPKIIDLGDGRMKLEGTNIIGSPDYVNSRQKMIGRYERAEKRIGPFAPPVVGLLLLIAVAATTVKEKAFNRRNGKD